MLPLGAMRMSVLLAVTETTWKSMIHAATGCYGQGSFFCSDIDYCRFTAENERHWRLLWQCPCPPPNSLNRKPLKRSLKHCGMDGEVELFTVDGFWCGEKGTAFFKELATGSLTVFQGVCEQHRLDLAYFFFFSFCFRAGTKLGRPGKTGYNTKFPNKQ